MDNSRWVQSPDPHLSRPKVSMSPANGGSVSICGAGVSRRRPRRRPVGAQRTVDARFQGFRSAPPLAIHVPPLWGEDVADPRVAAYVVTRCSRVAPQRDSGRGATGLLFAVGAAHSIEKSTSVVAQTFF